MKKNKKNTGHIMPLKWSMLLMLFVCWFLPLVILILSTLFIVSKKIDKQMENTIVTSTDKAVEICQLRLAQAIRDSRNASYLPTIKNSYEQYLKDGNGRTLYHDVNLFLSQQYKYRTDLKNVVLYFTEKPDTLYYTYSNSHGATYDNIRIFQNNAKELVQEKAKTIDTSIAFMNVGNHFYMIRNIVDSDFEPYAVIIMELDTKEMFGSLQSIWGYQDAEVYIDGESVFKENDTDIFNSSFSDRTLQHGKFFSDQNGYHVYHKLESDRHAMHYLVDIDKSIILSEKNLLRTLFVLFVCFMIPLVGMILFFFYRKITKPVQNMVEGYKEIEKEHYGYKMKLENDSQEFHYMGEAFNKMSDKLKNQFEKIYLEELALKDANIMARQSQINPHFLNNTLEIINWEARMSENYKVTGMIEALSVMLEATMNRENRQMISLSEELSYVDAYLYIIEQRFGGNIKIEKHIDMAQQNVAIPRLIIQPIIENAVEHGMDIAKIGKIILNIYREKEKLYIEVIDNGHMSKKDREKIAQLLHPDYQNKNHESVSLGISNVNKRLKIMYGDEYGLTINSDKDGYTVSTILVKIEEKSEQ